VRLTAECARRLFVMWLTFYRPKLAEGPSAAARKKTARPTRATVSAHPRETRVLSSSSAFRVWHEGTAPFPCKPADRSGRFNPCFDVKKSKIFCFEIDGRLVAKVFEVGGEPFIGPRSTHLMKVA
jgi:hypothetical protein